MRRFIVPLVITFNNLKSVYHVSEAYDTDLYYYMQSHRPYNNVINFLLQIANALVTLHSVGYAHLDVKPENILLRGRRAVLCDFATLCYLGKATSKQTQLRFGTIQYAPPELLRGEVSKKCDVYSFTKTVHVCMHGELPDLETMTIADYGDVYMFYHRGLQELPKDRMSSVELYKLLYYFKNNMLRFF